MKTTSSASTKVAYGVGAFLVFAVSFVVLQRVYLSLTAAFVVAYLLDPFVELLVDRKVSRGIGALIVLAAFFLGLGALIVLIVPKLVEQGKELIERLPQAYAAIRMKFAPLALHYLGVDPFADAEALLPEASKASGFVQPLGKVVGEVFGASFKVVTEVLGILIVPLMAYYLLRDFPRYYVTLLSLFPRRYHKTVAELRSRLNRVFGGFVRGQLGVSSILAVYYTTCFTILDLRLGLVLGLMAGFFNVIPYVGIATAAALTFLIAFVNGASLGKFIAILIVFAIGMAAEGSFLTPRIVGRKVGLSPLMLILALLIGNELQGLPGMLVAVPVAAIAKVFFGYAMDRYRGTESFNRET